MLIATASPQVSNTKEQWILHNDNAIDIKKNATKIQIDTLIVLTDVFIL